ncbi:MAG: hypothetical protein WC678_04765 [Parcubacteria group bacterium]|jgi:hypothetical protein
MEQKNKSILAVSIIVLAILTLILVAIIMKNKKKSVAPPKTNPNIEESQKNSTSQISEEKKAEVAAIRNIKGKITDIKIDSISVTPTTGEKLTLKVPQKGANFSSLTKQKDGSFMVKEIGLFEVPKNKEVSIQYNSTTNEVMLVEVR